MKKYKIKSFEFDLFTIALFILIIAAFIIRVCNLGYLTLWVDEYVHVDRARFWPGNPLLTDDNNGILYTIFIIPFFKLFGVNEFWARFPSVIFGVLLVWTVYLFGKKYFNRNVGLMTAALVTFSPYLAFWSRISRNYEIFAFFFILMLYFLGRAINVDDSFSIRKSKIWNYLKMQPKYLLITVGLLILSILSHQLTFLVIYGILFYYLLVFIDNTLHKKYNWLGVEAILSYLLIIFSVIVFIPSIQGALKSIFLLFLPQRIADWVLPNLARLSELWNTQPYQAFNIYFNVLKYDYNILYYLGFIGFIFGIIRYRKPGYFITAIFVMLFVLMSFIFREPSLPRYLIYIYPLFLIAIALTADTVILWISKYLQRKKAKFEPAYIVLVFILALCFTPSARSAIKMVTTKEHGQVASKELSSFYFPDWKSSLGKVKEKIGQDDLLISTMPVYVEFYLGRNSYWFRQRVYDTNQHQYVNYPVDLEHPNAHSTQALIKLLDGAEKGWVMVDYYFNNVMTDPETRTWIINNMKFEFDMSDQYVSVFSWDKQHPMAQNNTMFEFLNDTNPYTMEFQFNIPNVDSNILVILDMEGLVMDNQAILNINGNNIGIQRQYGEQYKQNGDSKSRQYYVIPVSARAFRQGANTLRLLLNTESGTKGMKFVVYNLNFQQMN